MNLHLMTTPDLWKLFRQNERDETVRSALKDREHELAIHRTGKQIPLRDELLELRINVGQTYYA